MSAEDVYTIGDASAADWTLEVGADGVVVVAVAADLLEEPELRTSGHHMVRSGPTWRFEGSFRVRLRGDSSAWTSIRRLADRHDGPIRTVLRLAGAVMLEGALSSVYTRDGNAVVEGFAHLPGANRPLSRHASLLRDEIGHSVDAWLPQVFGHAPLQPVALFPLESALLAEPLALGDNVLVLQRDVSWPQHGRLQMEDEVLRYTARGEDGFTIGTPDRPLERPERRDHPRGAVVQLLPEEGPAWCVADHPADVAEVRLRDEQGVRLDGHTVRQEALGPRIATILRRPRLPLSIRHGATTQERVGALDRRGWHILPETSAYNPLEAFSASVPQQGAVLTRERPLLAVVSNQNLAGEAERFDRIVSARLRFEVSDTPGWAPFTRVRVTASRGAQQRVIEIGPMGNVTQVPFEGVARFPGAAKGSRGVPAALPETLPVKGSFEFRLVYTAFTLDVSALLPAENSWEFFAAPQGETQVRFELIDPPDIPLWDVAVRYIRWETTVFAATGVEASTRLWCRVAGLEARPDGGANPARTVLRLLRDEDLAAVPDRRIDGASLLRGADRFDRSGAAFSAVFQDATTLDSALESALGESMLALGAFDGLWSASHQGIAAGESPAMALGGGEIVDLPADMRIVPSSGGGAGIPALRHREMGLVYTPGDSASRIVPLRWLTSGGRRLAEWLSSARVPSVASRRLVLTGGGLALPVGLRVRLPSSASNGEAVQGIVRDSVYTPGRTEVLLDRVTPVVFAEPGAGNLVIRDLRSGAVAFWLEGVLMARLDPRAGFLLAGGVKEGALSPVTGAVPLLFSPSEGRLYIQFDPPEPPRRAIAIDTAGNLLTSVPVSESAAIDAPSPEGLTGVSVEGLLMGGDPDAAAALVLNAERLLFAGRLHLHTVF